MLRVHRRAAWVGAGLAVAALATALLLARTPSAGQAIEPELFGSTSEGSEDPAALEVAGGARGVRAADDAPRSAPLEQVEDPAEDTLGESNAGELRFRLEARVLASEGGPIPGAEVWVEDGQLLARAGADGAVDKELRMEPDELRPSPIYEGATTFLIVAEGRTAAERRAVVRRRRDLRLGTIVLAPGGEVAGHVIDEAGRPIEGAWLSWRLASEYPQDEARARREGVGTRRTGCRSCDSEADGSFRLRGVPEGEGFVVAGAPARFYAWTSTIAVRAAGAPEQTIVLTLTGESLGYIEGKVLRPDGTLADGALVRYRPGKESGGWHWSGGADGGRFRLLVWGGVDYLFEASDPTGNARSARAERVRAGDPELVLALGEPQWLEVHVENAEGRPIPASKVRSIVGSDSQPLEPTPADAAGVARIGLPSETFSIEASAAGFRTATAGPFDPATVGKRIAIALAPGQYVGGRVLFRGHPVAGAGVALCETFEPELSYLSSELTPPELPFDVLASAHLGRDGTRTDAEGRFRVPVQRDGWAVLRVRAKGFPFTLRGPFAFAEGAAVDDLVIELERAGSIAGRVLVAPGADPEGRIVAASNGFGLAHTGTTDEEGTFSILDLEPGEYQLRPCTSAAAALLVLERRDRHSRGDVKWDCSVRPGTETRFDLDLREEKAYVVAGELGLALGPDWRCWLTVKDRQGELGSTLANEELAEDRSFEIGLSRGGRVELALTLVESHTSLTLHLAQELELALGRNEWRPQLSTSSLRVQSDLTGVSYPALRFRVVWEGAEGLTFTAYITLPDERAETVWRPLPAGRARLERFDPESERFALYRELDLPPGGEVQIELP